jgi:hypothetical protein
MQSVGSMDVIPILGESDATFAPPEVAVGTSRYGTVDLRNDADRITVVPPGAGWVVKQAAQDHAIGGGALVPAKSSRKIKTAMCIQQSQGGTIRQDKHNILILPVALRTAALSMRNRVDYAKLWESIAQFNKALGVERQGAHLEYFLRTYAKQLDEFVAEFELIPRQLGAIVLVGGKVVGVERTPSTSYWEVVWEPLIRVCYGSLAIQSSRAQRLPPSTRIALHVKERSLAGLRKALEEAEVWQQRIVEQRISEVQTLVLSESGADDKSGSVVLSTVASPLFAGQIVTVAHTVRYASLCAAAA